MVIVPVAQVFIMVFVQYLQLVHGMLVRNPADLAQRLPLASHPRVAVP